MSDLNCPVVQNDDPSVATLVPSLVADLATAIFPDLKDKEPLEVLTALTDQSFPDQRFRAVLGQISLLLGVIVAGVVKQDWDSARRILEENAPTALLEDLNEIAMASESEDDTPKGGLFDNGEFNSPN